METAQFCRSFGRIFATLERTRQSRTLEPWKREDINVFMRSDVQTALRSPLCHKIPRNHCQCSPTVVWTFWLDCLPFSRLLDKHLRSIQLPGFATNLEFTHITWNEDASIQCADIKSPSRIVTCRLVRTLKATSSATCSRRKVKTVNIVLKTPLCPCWRLKDQTWSCMASGRLQNFNWCSVRRLVARNLVRNHFFKASRQSDFWIYCTRKPDCTCTCVPFTCHSGRMRWTNAWRGVFASRRRELCRKVLFWCYMFLCQRRYTTTRTESPWSLWKSGEAIYTLNQPKAQHVHVMWSGFRMLQTLCVILSEHCLVSQ